MPITVILELWLKPESVPAARDHMRRAFQDTRAFDGNLGTDVLVDEDDVGLADPVDDRVPVCGVPGRDGTAGTNSTSGRGTSANVESTRRCTRSLCREVSLAGMLRPDAFNAYVKRATGEKFLVTPQALR